ncbi:hypothetical protein [Shewanella sp. Koi 1]
MDIHEQQSFDLLYEQHLTNLTFQYKRPATIMPTAELYAVLRHIFTAAPIPWARMILGELTNH